MSAVAFLLLALVIASVGSLVLYLRQRRPTSVESGIDSFREGMRALSDSRNE
ncbi:MAG TPA: hypothetical protein VK611_20420 [Acidimicrobiales bacterium]|nr:hypothetical protein [Acidimicrobiales bacterium]